MKKRIRLLLKTLFSLFLIGLLVSRIDFDRLAATISRIDPLLYFVVFLFVLAGTLVSTLKWRLLLRSLGMDSPFPSLLRIYYIGSFYNMFLPTTVGGDIVRGALLGKENRERVRTAASILGERLLGLHALLGISALSFFLYRPLFTGGAISTILWVSFSIFILLTSFLLFPRLIRIATRPGGKICDRLGWERGTAFLTRIETAFLDIRSDWKRLLSASGISFLFQLTLPLQSILIAHAMGIDIPWQYFFAIKPVAMLLTTLPLSFNGIGVREWVVIFLYGAVGVSREAILAVSFMGFFLVVCNALIGGVILLRNKRQFEKGSSQT